MSTPHSPRRRGRPAGPGYPQDRENLERMADHMLANPRAKKAEAARAAKPDATSADVARLSRLFRNSCKQLMQAAQERAAPKPSRVSASHYGWAPASVWSQRQRGAIGVLENLSVVDRMVSGGLSHTQRRILEDHERHQRIIDASYGGKSMRKLMEMLERERRLLRYIDSLR